MFGGITRIVTHRATGPVASLATLVLAAALAVTFTRARAEEEFLKGRIAALATHDASQLQAELVSCRSTVRSYAAALEASAPRGQGTTGAAEVRTSAHRDPGAVAAELAGTPPAGFDVCARMESADQAVLKALDRR